MMANRLSGLKSSAICEGEAHAAACDTHAFHRNGGTGVGGGGQHLQLSPGQIRPFIFFFTHPLKA